MHSGNSKKAFILSACLHVVVLLILIASFEFSAPMPVVSNNDSQVINAVALEDSPILAPPTKALEKPLPEVKEPPLIKTEPLPPPPQPASAKPAPAREEAAKAPPQTEKIAL